MYFLYDLITKSIISTCSSEPCWRPPDVPGSSTINADDDDSSSNEVPCDNEWLKLLAAVNEHCWCQLFLLAEEHFGSLTAADDDEDELFCSAAESATWCKCQHLVLLITVTSLLSVENVLPKPQGLQGSTDLRFLSPQPDTSSHCKTMDCTVHLFTSQLSLVLIVPTYRGMARLSQPGWLVK